MLKSQINLLAMGGIIFLIGMTILTLLQTERNNFAYGQDQNTTNLDNTTNSMSNSKFTVTLNGNEQVPPVITNAIGSASFELLKDKNILHYQVNVLDVPNVTGIHIHQGKKGQNGDVLVNLYKPKENNIFNLGNTSIVQNGIMEKMSQIDSSSITINGNTQSSLMISGTIDNLDLKGQLEGKQISDLITLMNNGDAYVNVHSESYADGEIRGQIE